MVLFREALNAQKELFHRLAQEILEYHREQSSPSNSSNSSHQWFQGDTLAMEEPCDPDDA